jgi:hypothetical protein
MILPASEWSQLLRPDGSVTELSQLPGALSDPVLRAKEIVSIASGIANPTPGLMVARLDLKDAPTVINIDKYSAIENLALHPIYPRVLQIAGLDDTPEIRTTLKNHVFVVKENPDGDHWVEDFPKIFLNGLKKDT